MNLGILLFLFNTEIAMEIDEEREDATIDFGVTFRPWMMGAHLKITPGRTFA